MPRQKVGDKEYEVREETFEILRQDWAEYVTGTGIRVRVKPEVVKIFRVLDDNGEPAVTPQGDPFLIVRNQVLVVASEGYRAH